MQIDYSDVDELQKIRCEACLPDDENKEQLWNRYLKQEGFSLQQFRYSILGFYNTSNRA